MQSKTLLTVLLIAALLIYYAPLILLDFAILKSDFFRQDSSLVASLITSFGSPDFGFSDTIRLVTATLAAGGISGILVNTDSAEKLSFGITALIISLVIILVLLVASFYAVDLSAGNLEEWRGSGAADPFKKWLLDRFTESMALLALVGGLKLKTEQ